MKPPTRIVTSACTDVMHQAVTRAVQVQAPVQGAVRCHYLMRLRGQRFFDARNNALVAQARLERCGQTLNVIGLDFCFVELRQALVQNREQGPFLDLDRVLARGADEALDDRISLVVFRLIGILVVFFLGSWFLRSASF